MAVEQTQLRPLTHSARSKFQACPRAYNIAYVQKIRPAESSAALAFGTAMHALLEVYWGNLASDISDDAFKPVLDAIDDPFDRAKAWALMLGYARQWRVSDVARYTTVAVEAQFQAPLMNPETGALSRTWALAGKIDGIIAEKDTGKTVILEHKTTSVDVAPGADYWLKLPIDGQVSGYYVGAQALGFDCQDCVYDVIRKPAIKPLKATPMESRKYKKDGTLYANCRETDETPEEYFARLQADIAERPEWYFARQSVARPDKDLVDYLEDMWMVGRQIADSERLNRWPRNPSSCNGFGKCDYFDVCAGMAGLDDVRFVRLDDANPEL